MKRLTTGIAVLGLIFLLILAAGCGGGNGESDSSNTLEEQKVAPVYPGATFVGQGTTRGTYKYTTKDPVGEVVNWYRKELSGKKDFSETNEYEDAVTGDSLSYKEDGKYVWLTVLPGMEGQPTTIEVSINTDFGTVPPAE